MFKWNPKITTSLKYYPRRQFLRDMKAGAIVAVIAFPLSFALAIASGMSPVTGLYSAIVGGFLVSLLGGSMVNIGGATAGAGMTPRSIVARGGGAFRTLCSKKKKGGPRKRPFFHSMGPKVSKGKMEKNALPST